jgi:hypothetical protein
MAALGQLVVSLVAETAQFRQDLDRAAYQAERGFQKMSQAAKTAGTALGIGLGAFGVTEIFRTLIDEAEQAERSLLRTQAVLDATGNAVGRSAQTLLDQAKSLSQATLQNESDVLQSQQILLSYSNIIGTQFDRTLELSADLAALMGTTLPSAVETFAKALDNPVDRISSLTRIGFNFTEQQKDQIKTLVESNKLFEAQNIILDIAQRSFGGLAKQEAMGYAGAQKELSEAIRDSIKEFSEQAKLLETSEKFMRSLASAITDITKVIIENSTALKIWVGVLVSGGLIVALPLLTAKLIAFAGAVGAVGLAFAANPVVLAILLLTAAAIPAVNAINKMVNESKNLAKEQENLKKEVEATAGATGNFTGLTEAQKEAAKKLAAEQKSIAGILIQQRDAYVQLFGSAEDVLVLRLRELNATELQIKNITNISRAIDQETKARENQQDSLRDSVDLAQRYLRLVDETSAPIDKLAAGEAALIRFRDELIKNGYTLADVENRIATARMNLMDSLFPPGQKDKIDELKEAIKEMGGVISTAFEDAIISGKGLRDIIKSLEQDIIRIITRRLVTQPLEGAISSWAGTFLEGFREGGGPVMRGSAYIVGEKGPELFVPSTSGNVVANHQLQGGQQMSVTNNFMISGSTDRRTQQQIAAAAGMGVQRAIARNT